MVILEYMMTVNSPSIYREVTAHTAKAGNCIRILRVKEKILSDLRAIEIKHLAIINQTNIT